LRKRNRSSARQLEGMRILVVEDNLLNQQVAEELLHSEGAQVALAANGRLGVNAVATANPQFDAVLMDIQMPVMDGFAATKTIREQLGLRTLPIIAMTANAMASDREECLAAGMNEHVGKPFDLAALVQTLLLHTAYVPRRPRTGVAGTAPAAPAAPSSPTQEIAGLDLHAALSRMSGLQSLYVRSAEQFLPTLDDCVATYRENCATAPEQARMQMHTLKSTAALLGATELADLAAQAEAVCKNSGADLHAEPEASELEQVITRTRAQLHSAIQLLSAAPSTTPSQASRAQTLQNLKELANVLGTGDLQALEIFARARESLQHLPAQTFEKLEQSLQNLDLEAALQHCQNLIDAL
jgi:CheY-like chemotaxis protein